MNILVLSKRQYTNKDLLDDRYGRLWEIPVRLADSGHQVKGVCLSYRKRVQGEYTYQTPGGNSLLWLSFNLFPGLLQYLFRIHRLLRQNKTDVIWVSSDCLHIIAGVMLGQIYHIPCVADCYDNYEYFGLSSIPGVVPMYRWAIRKAATISCISKPLQCLLEHTCKPEGGISVIENAVDTELFYPREKKACRNHLGLPSEAVIIGTAGALDSNRSIESLYQAFVLLSEQIDGLRLLVAGAGKRNHPIFKQANVHDLGMLDNQLVPLLFNCLDVAVICNQDNEFARYSYPQKANEILACETPLVAADIGVMSEILKAFPQCLFKPGSGTDLADKIAGQLTAPAELKVPVQTWTKQAIKLQQLLLKATRNK